MIDGWKVRRELARLALQLRAIPEAIWEPFARRSHDRALARGFPIMEGALAQSGKIAIVLCWQPRGVSASFLVTLDHLTRSGYAPFVISNAPLSDDDRTALGLRSWRILLRPNFGYDFGGYRDGIAMLLRWNLHPDRLVILNDSIWFPLWQDDRTLQHMEEAPFDVVGTILRTRDEISFLESYFFSIRGDVLDHPAFQSYWRKLRLTSNKYKVIRRGERGFGVALKRAGLKMGALFGNRQFLSQLAEADGERLRQVLRFVAHPDRQIIRRAEGLSVAAEGEGWRRSADAFFRETLERAQFYSTFPAANAEHLPYPVLKKSAEPVSANWRSAFLRAVDAGVLPHPLPSVLAEARERTKEMC